MKKDKEFDELEKRVKELKVGIKKPVNFKKYGLTLVPAVFVIALVIGFSMGFFDHSPAPTGYATLETENQGNEPSEQAVAINEEISEAEANETTEIEENTE